LKEVKGYNFRDVTTSPITGKYENYFRNNKSQIKVPSSNINLNSKRVKKVIRNICDLTKMGHNSLGNKKFNQDNFFIHYNFIEPNNMYFGVCDGHGILGHLVSSFIKDNLPFLLERCIKRRSKTKKINNNILKNINRIIEDVFQEINYKICNQQTYDSNFSGSTCCSVIYLQEKLITANVGDSRVVLGRLEGDKWASHNLSRDHKPIEPDEKIRILSKGGRVQQYKDENGEFLGPLRVWLQNQDIPGLAMSRSFGDQVASSVGVISIPEIKEYYFSKNDKFIIIASDGLWEFIDSDECVNMVKDFYINNDIKGASEFLLKESTSRWLNHNDSVDDITLILIFLE